MNNGVFMITGKKLNSICSILNSNLMIFYLNMILSESYQYGSKELFENIPVVQTEQDKTHTDSEVYSLYKLTELEINFISNSLKL